MQTRQQLLPGLYFFVIRPLFIFLKPSDTDSKRRLLQGGAFSCLYTSANLRYNKI